MISPLYFLLRPWAATLLGVVSALGGAFIAWKGYEATQAHQVQVSMRGSELPREIPDPGLWVKLHEVAWDCTEYAEEDSQLIVTGAILPQGRPIVARYPRGVDPCADGAPLTVVEGIVEDIWPPFLERLRGIGFSLQPVGDETVLSLFVGADASTARATIIGGLSFLGGGILITAMGIWMSRMPRWYVNWRIRAGLR